MRSGPTNNRATNTPITIQTASGPVTIRVNQREKPPIDGWFRSLGTFALDEDASIAIATEETDGYVVVDAVQLLPAR